MNLNIYHENVFKCFMLGFLDMEKHGNILIVILQVNDYNTNYMDY